MMFLDQSCSSQQYWTMKIHISLIKINLFVFLMCGQRLFSYILPYVKCSITFRTSDLTTLKWPAALIISVGNNILTVVFKVGSVQLHLWVLIKVLTHVTFHFSGFG